MVNENISEIGFEKQIWDAADELRGSMDAAEYKHVVLGLIFLKYLSDKFEEKYQELVDEGEGFEEDIDEYTSENIFFVPEEARWNTIASAAHTPEIGTVIDNAMRAIEAENKTLKNVLPKNYARLCGLLRRERSRKARLSLLMPERWGTWLTASIETSQKRISRSWLIPLRHSKMERLRM